MFQVRLVEWLRMTIIPRYTWNTKASAHTVSCIVLERLESQMRRGAEDSWGLKMDEVDGCCQLPIDWIIFSPRQHWFSEFPWTYQFFSPPIYLPWNKLQFKEIVLLVRAVVLSPSKPTHHFYKKKKKKKILWSSL